MSLEGKSPIYLFLDSSYRDRTQYPHSSEFETSFSQQADVYSPKHDLILAGTSVGIGGMTNFNLNGLGEYPPYYGLGWVYIRAFVYFHAGAVPGTTAIVWLMSDPDARVLIEQLNPNSLNGTFIEFYDDLNPSVSHINKVIYYNVLQETGDPEIPLVSKIYLEKVFPFDITYETTPYVSFRDYGPAVIHGTITEATKNTVKLFPGALVSQEKDFYKGKYFLIVDIDTQTGSGRYENINRLYYINSYDQETFTINISPNFKFIPSPNTRYEILNLHRANTGQLLVPAKSSLPTQFINYDVNIVNLSIPNGAGYVPIVSNITHSDLQYNRKDLREFPYIYVEITNLNGGSGQNVISTNNPYMNFAKFVCFIREDENVTATRALLSSGETHTLSLKLNDALKISLKTPAGQLLRYIYTDFNGLMLFDHDGKPMIDRPPPFSPEPFLQTKILLSLRPR